MKEYLFERGGVAGGTPPLSASLPPTSLHEWCRHHVLIVVRSVTRCGSVRFRERCPMCWKGYPRGASGWGAEKAVERFGPVKVKLSVAENDVRPLDAGERVSIARKWVWRVQYETHLASDRWRQIRAAKLTAAGGACERCGDPAEHIHHLTYQNLGDEPQEDLEALCRPCHWQEHGRIF